MKEFWMEVLQLYKKGLPSFLSGTSKFVDFYKSWNPIHFDLLVHGIQLLDLKGPLDVQIFTLTFLD